MCRSRPKISREPEAFHARGDHAGHVHDPSALADAYPNFSICGLPYVVGGDVPEWRSLAHRSLEELERAGIEILFENTARTIDPARKQVRVADPAGRERQLTYDRLIVATGAGPILPPIGGLDLPGIHMLHTMADAVALHDAITVGNARSAVIVGAGYIGLEMAEAYPRGG